MGNRNEDRHRAWTSIYAGYGIAGIIVAFGYQPLLRFLSPTIQGTLFLALAIGAAALYESWIAETRAGTTAGFVLGCAAAVVFVPMAVYSLSLTRQASLANDRRCLIIEREMMRGEPRRDDLPDMFQAFGCRPQTDIMPRRPIPEPTPVRPTK